MNVLVIGSGGREHAIAWKLRQSPLLTDLHVAPGNGGTAAIAHNLDLPLPRTGSAQPDVDAYLAAAVRAATGMRADLVFVAPDDPLAWGMVDRMEAAGIAAFGPSAAAAELEGSKAWAKQLMQRHGIPHTATRIFDDPAAAREFVRSRGAPVVIKADGLAAGKGAIVTSNSDEALAAIDELVALGDAGRRLTIEDRVSGREVSGHAFSDGTCVVPMPLSCDHKPVFDGNQGPNTGGMGVYSPPWWATGSLHRQVTAQVLEPLVAAMRSESRPFRGIVYPGIFVNESGIQVFECNARFGDPEAQALLPRLKTDLMEIARACVNGSLAGVNVEWSPEASVCVVLASGGYPGSYPTGLRISGLEQLDPDALAFHAGTRRGSDSSVLTAGGRVLGIVATGPTLRQAREKAYANVARVHFEGVHFRRDIALEPDDG
jgi:phosphoribosylamine--glycine ligase